MYNATQKERYMKTLTDSSRDKAKAVFKRTDLYESKIDLDCSLFTAQEILACFKQMNSASINTLRNAKSALSVYADWCKEQNLLPDGINHYREISQPDLLDCMSNEKLERSYLSAPEVRALAASMPNALESVAILLAYEGFLFANYDACYTLGTSDLDGNTLTAGDHTSEASQTLIDYMYEAEAADLYFQCFENGDVKEIRFQDGGGPIFKQLYNNVRPYDTMDLRRHYFERLFRRIRDRAGEDFITIKKLNESGRINALKSFMAAEGAEKDARAVFLAHKRELDLKYGTILEVGRFFAVHKDAFAAD